MIQLHVKMCMLFSNRARTWRLKYPFYYFPIHYFVFEIGLTYSRIPNLGQLYKKDLYLIRKKEKEYITKLALYRQTKVKSCTESWLLTFLSSPSAFQAELREWWPSQAGRSKSSITDFLVQKNVISWFGSFLLSLLQQKAFHLNFQFSPKERKPQKFWQWDIFGTALPLNFASCY